MKKLSLLIIVLLVCVTTHAQDENESVVDVIKKHGLENSEVMEIAGWLTDVYGPRLTGSPMLDKATNWVVDELNDWGRQCPSARMGTIWKRLATGSFEMHVESPSYWPAIAYPKAWSPSTNSSGEVIYLEIKDESDIEKYRGKLEGKIVLMDTIRDVSPPFQAMARRFETDRLFEMATAGPPTPRPRRGSGFGRFALNRAIWSMLDEEGPLAVLDRSYKGDLGTVFVSGARTGADRAYNQDKKVVPQITLSIEHYNRILRLMEKDIPVTLSLDLQSSYHNDDGMEHNVIAEIPGTDLQDEVVIFGAHLDSWHTGTGATDNAAGSAVMMEVARILLQTIEETGIQPRRTLRLALWTGEEQGLHGSRNYVGDFLCGFW